MLSSLKIENLALVKKVNWNLNEGLTAVTGETGAGKSVIIGALKLLAGERGDKGVIRNGEEKTVVHGVFDLVTPEVVNAVLIDAGLPECEGGQLFLRRVIGHKSSKQFINDESCTLASMKKLGELLMDLHGPHDHQSLFSNERQMQLLDRYAGLGELGGEYQILWKDYLNTKAEYEDFMDSEMLSESELELYRFQLEEITEAELDSAEITDLEEQYQRASNATELNQSVAAAIGIISDEEGVVSKLNDLARVCRDLQDLDASLAGELNPVEASVIEIQEVDNALRNYLDRLDLDPTSFQELEERFNIIESLKRKYGGSIEDVLEHAERIEKRLSQTDRREATLAEYEVKLEKHQTGLKRVAKKISQQRKNKAPILAQEITTHLQDLGFKQAKFDLVLNPSEELTVRGHESLEFVFGPNPGEPLKPLKQVASSGEMSRVMLALKSSLAEHDEVPLLVFDEIDANVGGEIAASVGQKMKVLSQHRQVLSITHFPQVAAIAPSHCLVQKGVENSRTLSYLSELSGDARVDELVRMLGASGDQARALALSLLETEREVATELF